MPAYWWMYNMYALERNSSKFHQRDVRITKVQNIEFEPFAPDTIEEVFNARRLLEIWTAKAFLRKKNSKEIKNQEELAKLGQTLLHGTEESVNNLEVLGENMENSNRKVLILKIYKAYHAYGDMLHYYAVKNLLAYLSANPDIDFLSMCNVLKGSREKDWINMGGQIMRKKDVDKLRSDIGSEKLNSWEKIHNRYDLLWTKYALHKQKHAFASLCELSGAEEITREQWIWALDKAADIQKFICDQVYVSRKKDFDNPYRKTTFRNTDEMKAVIGAIEDNGFIVRVRQKTENFIKLVNEIKKRK